MSRFEYPIENTVKGNIEKLTVEICYFKVINLHNIYIKSWQIFKGVAHWVYLLYIALLKLFILFMYNKPLFYCSYSSKGGILYVF